VESGGTIANQHVFDYNIYALILSF